MAAPLWTCPRCQHQFVTANIWHSCTDISLDQAFAKAAPALRGLFDRYVELIARCGPVTVIPQKTRIVIVARVRFAGAVVHRDYLTVSFALPRRLDDPRFRVESYGERWNAHRWQVRTPADLEIPGLPELLCEAFHELGMQGAPYRRRRGTKPTSD